MPKQSVRRRSGDRGTSPDLFYLDQRRAVPVRRGGGAAPTVVSVWIPRRMGVLAVLLNLPAFVDPRGAERGQRMDRRAGLGVGLAGLRFGLLHLAPARVGDRPLDRLFDPGFRRAERRLEKAGREIRQADSLDEIERLLVEEPAKASGSPRPRSFARGGRRLPANRQLGWDAVGRRHAEGTASRRFLSSPAPRRSRSRRPPGRSDDSRGPSSVCRSAIARRRFAVVLYSGHEVGTDLKEAERELLGALARDAEIAYGQVERETLQKRVERLEGLLGASGSGLRPCRSDD